jgi:hypothetical protein
MQHFQTRHYSSTPLLIAAVGVGSLVAYALSSPRRRAALIAAGESAVETGSRLATRSAERLHDLVPQQALDAVNDLTATARSATAREISATADKLRDFADRASNLVREMPSRARRLASDANLAPRQQIHDALEAADDVIHGRAFRRASGVMITAAAVGAGLYAMQRYGVIDRAGERLAADEGGTIKGRQELD